MSRLLVLACLVMAFPAALQSAEPQKYDVLIRNGRIVDGTGSPWYHGDIAIQNGKIVAIGPLDEEVTADDVIDAQGLIVAPGFIDMMGQTATPMLRDPETCLNLLTQGITTINAGEGSSAAPLNAEAALREGWSEFADYFQLLEMRGLPVNVAQTIGHTQVREMVLGDIDRRPTDDELKRMEQYVDDAMRAGAIGVSTALIYPPATYASQEEIAALCRVAGKYGGRYYTHMRNEGDRLLEAIDEALEIGRMAGVPVHIFHLKAAGSQNWDKMEQALNRIAEARANGQQVTADIYPYLNNGLGLEALIHPRHFTEGYRQFYARLDDEELRKQIRDEMENTDGWENWFRHTGHDWNKVIIGQTGDKELKDYAGQSVKAMADATGKDVWDVFFQLVKGNSFALPETMSEANKIKAMQRDFISFCTDVGPASGDNIAAHPRAYGSFPKLLAHYVREQHAISLERAVSQASALGANEVLAYDRGRLAIGQAADVIVFDAEHVTDHATFADPRALSDGMKFVLVNGRVVLKDGKYTGERPGRVLRGPGYDPQSAPSQVITGEPSPAWQAIDVHLPEIIQRESIPGLAVAVMDQGELVYSRGFGYANLAEEQPVQPDSLFRIASISKPLTAVAVLQLVDQGKFALDDPMLPLLNREPFLRDDDEVDERLQSIRIRDLLQHSGGWDRDASFDAMFQSVRFARRLGVDAPAGSEDVIRVMLGMPLDFDPGTKYAYSNLGYCMLGRIIENVSGQPYEEYVKEHVLAPLGITSMTQGHTLLDQKLPNEVRYYDPYVGRSVFQGHLREQVTSPYGEWYLEAMDSHGGWLATAPNLARFAAAFDDPQNCPILSEESIHEMFGKPEGVDYGNRGSYYYGLGWAYHRLADSNVEAFDHSGSLPGTLTVMVHRDDGRDYAVLGNSRITPHPGNWLGPVINLMDTVCRDVSASESSDTPTE